MNTTSDFKVGEKVIFGRSHGEQTEGTVVKVNRTKLKVRQDESRGSMRSYPVGSIWGVPPSLCRKVGQTTPVANALTLTVGQTVEYIGFSWAARGNAVIKGVITKVGHDAYEVYGEGRTQVLSHTAVKVASKRAFDIVKVQIAGCYARLSPENLTCDGERPRSQVQIIQAQLNRALKALFIEAGRKLDEGECY